jgi:hypothetical protein
MTDVQELQPLEVKGKPAMLKAVDALRERVEAGEVDVLVLLYANYTPDEDTEEDEPNYWMSWAHLDTVRYPWLVVKGLAQRMLGDG